jgi:glycogen debranching enzyme
MPPFTPNPFLLALRPALAEIDSLMRRGIQTDPDTGLDYFTGYAYRTLYDWDQYFESIVQIYMGWPAAYIQNGVIIFLEHQRESGLISRSVPSNEFHDPEHVKPFLAQIALLVYRAYGELDWITSERYFPRLQRAIDYWLEEMDSGGLSVWMSAPHTGMDNQHERAGYWLDRLSQGVDLNSYLVREMTAFACLAELAGKPDLASHYRQKAQERAARVRDGLWDAADGFFYDGNARAGEPLFSRHAGWAAAVNNGEKGPLIRVKSAAAFAALWAGIATPEQARRMAFEHLFNPREFWTPFPAAAMPRSERWYSRDWHPADLGCNWRAKTWVPTNFMIYHGLRRYGFRELASLVAQATADLVRRAGNCEYYDAETGEGCGLDPFWGWSLLGHFMAYEEQADVLVHHLE